VEERLVKGLFASVRVVGEPVMAGVKRCRIVKEVLRLTTEDIADRVLEIAWGVHHLRVSCRHPLPGFDVLSLMNFA
jgi:hypothetical protein